MEDRTRNTARNWRRFSAILYLGIAAALGSIVVWTLMRSRVAGEVDVFSVAIPAFAALMMAVLGVMRLRGDKP